MKNLKRVVVGIILISEFCYAQTLPIASPEQFVNGNTWTWTYYSNGDLSRPYSSEKYEVIRVEGSLVTFEIQSKYSEKSSFSPNTRFKVNLEKCKQAFSNPDVKVNFMIALYPLQNGVWERTPIWSSATAFEEKFNCNPIIHSRRNSLYETRFQKFLFGGVEELFFQQWPKFGQSQLLSFYFINHPDLIGVAFRKEFSPGTPHYYEMRLTEYSRH